MKSAKIVYIDESYNTEKLLKEKANNEKKENK